jgi:hypothetical protein
MIILNKCLTPSHPCTCLAVCLDAQHRRFGRTGLRSDTIRVAQANERLFTSAASGAESIRIRQSRRCNPMRTTPVWANMAT